MIIYENILREFQKQKVKYVLVGGIAYNLLGGMRATYDLDLLVELTDTNLKKVVSILKKKGYRVKQPVDPMDFAVRGKREDWIKNKHLKAFNFYKNNTLEEVDLIIDSPVSYQQAKKNATLIKVENLRLPVISIDDLIKMKRKAGRDMDKIDINNLQKIKKLEENI